MFEAIGRKRWARSYLVLKACRGPFLVRIASVILADLVSAYVVVVVE